MSMELSTLDLFVGVNRLKIIIQCFRKVFFNNIYQWRHCSALKKKENIQRWFLAFLHAKEVLKVDSSIDVSCLKYANTKSLNIHLK